MKKTSLLLLFSLSINLLAQTNVYHPFPDSDVVWAEGYTYVSGLVGVTCPQWFFLSGDTIIATRKYKKLLSDGYCYSQSTCCYYNNRYEGALRQDTIQKKVYYRNPAATSDTLLYNFNLNPGDTLQSYIGSFPNYISSVDSILIGTTYRKQYHVSFKNSGCQLDSNYFQIIEGMGSTLGIISSLNGNPDCGDNGGPYFNCFSENQTVLYTKPNATCDMTLGISENINRESFSIFPNPSYGIFNLQINNQQIGEGGRIEIYNTLGEKLYSATPQFSNATINISDKPKGIYFVKIISGAKFIARKIVLL